MDKVFYSICLLFGMPFAQNLIILIIGAAFLLAPDSLKIFGIALRPGTDFTFYWIGQIFTWFGAWEILGGQIIPPIIKGFWRGYDGMDAFLAKQYAIKLDKQAGKSAKNKSQPGGNVYKEENNQPG